MTLSNEQIQTILDGAPEGLDMHDRYLNRYWEDEDVSSLSDLREILTLRQEVERLKGHFDKYTGLPASVGICEPVEGYAEEPYFLHSAIKEMAEKIKQLESQQSEVAARAVEGFASDLRERAKLIPLGAECKSKGASTYNWQMFYSEVAENYANQLREQSDD